MGDPPQSSRLVAGRYRVLEELGRGGMGSVHRAFDEFVGEPVALKTLHTTIPELVERFKRELVLARRVTHRNIARTFDMGLDRGEPFITMELVQGESVRERFARGPRELGEIVSILGQVASGLAAAHAASVVHQDLKPGNVLIDREGRVVVIDFGVARLFDPTSRDGDELAGTLDYMAPEQVAGSAPRPATDLYALGVMAFEMLLRKRPFDGATPHERALARLGDRPPPLSGVRAVPEALGRLVDRCLAFEPDARPTASEVVLALDELATPRGASSSSPPPIDEELTSHDPTDPARTIRVLPFATEGAAARAWDVGAGLAEEIADLLSRTRGIELLSSVGANARARASDFVVHGTVRDAGEALVVTARLIDDVTGAQLWSARFEGATADLLDIGARLSAQIAEALRLELEAIQQSSGYPAKAVETYLSARSILRSPARRPSDAVHLLDRCLAIAPAFPAAVAARAVAVSRAFFFGDFGAGDLSREAPRAVEQAVAMAEHLPDTQLAVGLYALLRGRFSEAARAFVRAVDLAPTHSLALEQLGRLEIEAGRGAQGLARLKLVATIDPRRRTALYPVARAYALRNNLDAFERTMRSARSFDDRPILEEVALETRVATWTRDRRRAVAAREQLERLSDHVAYRLVGLGAELAAGHPVGTELQAATEQFLELPLSPRLATVIHQTTCEHFADVDAGYALTHLARAVDVALVDIEWVELCPALDPLRETGAFERARRTVLTRIRSTWPRP
jgi:serine/threonine-protein kinase